jgi:hypothetical protein
VADVRRVPSLVEHALSTTSATTGPRTDVVETCSWSYVLLFCILTNDTLKKVEKGKNTTVAYNSPRKDEC